MERVLGYIGAKDGLHPCPLHTFKIKIINPKLLQKNKYLHMRRMYNNDVYCIEQPNFYGKINSIDYETMEIFWKQKYQAVLATYQKISSNTYINRKNIH